MSADTVPVRATDSGLVLVGDGRRVRFVEFRRSGLVVSLVAGAPVVVTHDELASTGFHVELTRLSKAALNLLYPEANLERLHLEPDEGSRLRIGGDVYPLRTSDLRLPRWARPFWTGFSSAVSERRATGLCADPRFAFEVVAAGPSVAHVAASVAERRARRVVSDLVAQHRANDVTGGAEQP